MSLLLLTTRSFFDHFPSSILRAEKVSKTKKPPSFADEQSNCN